MILVSSCSCLCLIQWSQLLSREWRCSWSSADRQCSNYIWVINNFIAFSGATYIRFLRYSQKTPHISPSCVSYGWFVLIIWRENWPYHNRVVVPILWTNKKSNYLLPGVESIHVIGRLDARYDWLPSSQSTFGNKSLPAADGGDGCKKVDKVQGKLALLTDGKCSYYTKVNC